jgi:hypothetical protein
LRSATRSAASARRCAVGTLVSARVASVTARYELEATMVGGGFSDDLLAELAPPAA